MNQFLKTIRSVRRNY